MHILSSDGSVTDLTQPFLSASKGDLVVDRKGQLFRVDKVASVNYYVTDEDDRQWKIRKVGVFRAPEGALFSGTPASDAPRLYTGTVVTFNAGRFADGNLYVVIRDGGDSVSVARLNGGGGRYVRGISTSNLTVVKV